MSDELTDLRSSSEMAARLATEEDADLRTALAELSQLTISQGPLPEMLTHVAEFAVRAIPNADGAGLTVLNTGNGKADTVVATAPFVEKVEEIQYGIGEGPCITAAAEGRTVVTGSLGQDRMWPRFEAGVAPIGVRSVLSMPLHSGDGVVGAINVYARVENAFDDRAMTLGELFAVPAAAAVRTAQDLMQAQRLVAQLETALVSRAVIDQAMGIVMSRSGCTPDEAFRRLRAISQAENRRLAVVAQRVVDESIRRARARPGHPPRPSGDQI